MNFFLGALLFTWQCCNYLNFSHIIAITFLNTKNWYSQQYSFLKSNHDQLQDVMWPSLMNINETILYWWFMGYLQVEELILICISFFSLCQSEQLHWAPKVVLNGNSGKKRRQLTNRNSCNIVINVFIIGLTKLNLF